MIPRWIQKQQDGQDGDRQSTRKKGKHSTDFL
jgi:hypothetical protein